MVGTFPPLYESLPDLTLLFIANNPGTVSASCTAMSPGFLYCIQARLYTVHCVWAHCFQHVCIDLGPAAYDQASIDIKTVTMFLTQSLWALCQT